MLFCKFVWKVKSWRGYVYVNLEIILYELFKIYVWIDILLFNKEIIFVWEGEGVKL